MGWNSSKFLASGNEAWTKLYKFISRYFPAGRKFLMFLSDSFSKTLGARFFSKSAWNDPRPQPSPLHSLSTLVQFSTCQFPILLPTLALTSQTFSFPLPGLILLEWVMACRAPNEIPTDSEMKHFPLDSGTGPNTDHDWHFWKSQGHLGPDNVHSCLGCLKWHFSWYRK